MFTVKQLSSLAGITPRTLHHYDAIDLLKPTRIGRNGYRYYGEDALLRLQQILFYRELGLPLEDIKKIMGKRDFDILNALQSHRVALELQVRRLNHLIRTVDNTINYMKGNKTMDEKDLFGGFTEEEEQKYTEEAEKLYDPLTVKASAKMWNTFTPAVKKRIIDEGNAVYRDILASMPRGASSPETQACIDRWRRHIEYFWKPDDKQLVGLAELYNADSKFKANFDKIDPNLAGFIREAVKIYVHNRNK
jgi:MerR family transcriptional regulator, thiopeptide resistance regulator